MTITTAAAEYATALREYLAADKALRADEAGKGRFYRAQQSVWRRYERAVARLANTERAFRAFGAKA